MTNKNKNKYKLNLPDTIFPMRGNLAKREPDWVNQWNKRNLYKEVSESRKENEMIQNILKDAQILAGESLNKTCYIQVYIIQYNNSFISSKFYVVEMV